LMGSKTERGLQSAVLSALAKRRRKPWQRRQSASNKNQPPLFSQQSSPVQEAQNPSCPLHSGLTKVCKLVRAAFGVFRGFLIRTNHPDPPRRRRSPPLRPRPPWSNC
jgi:hypothetical protein